MKEIKFSGNLRSLDPKRLVDKEEDKAIESFFLVLGIFYNDLKSLTFYFVQLGNAFDDLDKYEVVATKEFGEYHGIKSHLDRLLAGTLSEFFKFVKQNKSVLDHLWFKSAYNSLNLDLRSRWDLIVEIATGSQVSDESDFASVLLLIRNNLSFHYFQSAKRMRAGFVKHFFDDPKTPANDKAYYSTGETMEDTRFFFSDAASTQATQLEISSKMDHKKFYDLLNTVYQDLNFTIMRLIKGYISQKPYR